LATLRLGSGVTADAKPVGARARLTAGRGYDYASVRHEARPRPIQEGACTFALTRAPHVEHDTTRHLHCMPEFGLNRHAPPPPVGGQPYLVPGSNDRPSFLGPVPGSEDCFVFVDSTELWVQGVCYHPNCEQHDAFAAIPYVARSVQQGPSNYSKCRLSSLKSSEGPSPQGKTVTLL